MRVLRLITRLNIGGPSIQAIELTCRLAERGYATTLAHGVAGVDEGDMRYRLGAPPWRGFDVVEIPTLRRPVSPVDDPRAVGRVLALMRRIKPAVVHTHMAKAGTVGRLAALIYNRTAGRERVRVVHTYHGHVLEGYFSAARSRVFIGIERTLARATDRIIAISPRICDELQQQYRIGVRDQYRVIVLGFDLRPFAAIDDRNRQAARRALEIPSGAAVVTTVGRITPIKDQRLFLDVAKRVLEERADVVFLIVGDGELRPELEQLVRALAIAGRVRFLGWRRDLETIYAATDVFLLTSRNEGTPVALIESLAAGCAGVSTDVGGVGDVLTNDEVGLLAPAADGAKLATHVLALLGDPERRQRMGEAGRRSVLDRFSVERLVDDIDRVYRELVDAPSAEATP